MNFDFFFPKMIKKNLFLRFREISYFHTIAVADRWFECAALVRKHLISAYIHLEIAYEYSTRKNNNKKYPQNRTLYETFVASLVGIVVDL